MAGLKATNIYLAIQKASDRSHIEDQLVLDGADAPCFASPMPVGAHESDDGVNFAIFSRYANRERLEFVSHPEAAAPGRAIDLDSARNHTGDIWHGWVKGIAFGQLYNNFRYGVNTP